jgi:hypothetical protein
MYYYLDISGGLTKCPSAGGTQYRECCSACRGHCRDMEIADNTCQEECIPGCMCPVGQVMDDNGDCVKLAQCTCYDKYATEGDKIRDAGDVVERNCHRWYVYCIAIFL